MDYDETAIAETYDAVRSFVPGMLHRWLSTLSSSLRNRNVARIIDLGCGTGRFSLPLALNFQAEVLAIDPSESMINEAKHHVSHGRIRFVRGSAEALPVDKESADLVFISMALHHFSDLPLAVAECHRVLRPEGVVCVYTGVTERIQHYAYVSYFPASADLLADRLPSYGRLVDVFERGDFRLMHHELVANSVAVSWADYASRLAKRADSILVQLSPQELERGLTLMRMEGARGDRGPVVEPVDFFVFGK